MTQENAPDVTVLQEKVRQIITEELELEPGELTESGHFIEDYDADSLSLITILARIEKELGLAVPQDEMPNMADLSGVYEVMARHAAEPQGV
jgi:acyl carrier protein